jgi:presenilin-like A22 family membrane protease
MRLVARGNPQAGLPLLNGGALVGYAIGYLLLFHSLGLGLGLNL